MPARSDDARRAGVWAIDALQRQLGPRWPRAWSPPGGPPPELFACSWSLAGFLATLELALSLHLLRDVSGIRAVRDVVRSTGQPQQLASPRLQLRLASLGLMIGGSVLLEPTLPGARTPADLVIAKGATNIRAELMAILRDDPTVQADRWLSGVGLEMLLLGQEHQVDFSGEIESSLDETETVEFLGRLADAAVDSAATKSFREVVVGAVRIRVLPAAGQGGARRVKLPSAATGVRLAAKIDAKAQQTRTSRARWLIVDSFDQLFHLSSAGRLPFPAKAVEIAAFVRSLLERADHLHGIVISDGGALSHPYAREQTAELPCAAVALSRRRNYLNLRESIIVPLRSAGRGEAEVWAELLDGEARWLPWALAQVGLPKPLELHSGRPG